MGYDVWHIVEFCHHVPMIKIEVPEVIKPTDKWDITNK